MLMAKKQKDMSWFLDDEDDNIIQVIDSNGSPLLA
jgi:hypothetical protein